MDGTSKYYKETYKPGSIVAAWLAEMSGYIKTKISSKVLVTSGEEGYRNSHDDPSCLTESEVAFIHDGSKGVDFETNAQISTIDFMTTHLYLDNWNISTDLFISKDGKKSWHRRCILEDRKNIAKKNGKPIILEESGFHNKPYGDHLKDYAENRPKHLKEILSAAWDTGYQGLMVWQVVPSFKIDGQSVEEGGFTFTFDSPEGKVVLDQIKDM